MVLERRRHAADHRHPVAPDFSGTATYEHAIELDAATLAGRRWILDLGDVGDVAEVAVNGHDLAGRSGDVRLEASGEGVTVAPTALVYSRVLELEALPPPFRFRRF